MRGTGTEGRGEREGRERNWERVRSEGTELGLARAHDATMADSSDSVVATPESTRRESLGFPPQLLSAMSETSVQMR
eukprot:6184441-Pleurochrysis_carterae.AAC.2